MTAKDLDRRYADAQTLVDRPRGRRWRSRPPARAARPARRRPCCARCPRARAGACRCACAGTCRSRSSIAGLRRSSSRSSSCSATRPPTARRRAPARGRSRRRPARASSRSRSTSAHDYDPQSADGEEHPERAPPGRRPRPGHVVDDRELQRRADHEGQRERPPGRRHLRRRQAGRQRHADGDPEQARLARRALRRARRRRCRRRSTTGWTRVGGGSVTKAQAALRAQHRRHALPLLPGLDHRAAAGRQEIDGRRSPRRSTLDRPPAPPAGRRTVSWCAGLRAAPRSSWPARSRSKRSSAKPSSRSQSSRERQAAGLPQLREDARRREARHRVELVDQHAVALDEEVHPREPRAADAQERLAREAAHLVGHGVGDPGRHPQLHPARAVLGLVVVPVGAAPGRSRRAPRPPGRRARSPSTRPRARRRTPRRSPGCRARTRPRAPPRRSASAHTLAIPTEEPSRAGLTKIGVPSCASCARTPSGSSRQRASRTPAERTCGTPGRVHDLLEDDLVHAQRRGEHARADVGHVEQLEHALDRAVLAERPVQHRERRRRRRAGPRRAAGSAPRRRASTRRCASISTGETSWPAGGDALAHGLRPSQRDLVLGRAPAVEDGDPHGVGRGARRGRRAWSRACR